MSTLLTLAVLDIMSRFLDYFHHLVGLVFYSNLVTNHVFILVSIVDLTILLYVFQCLTFLTGQWFRYVNLAAFLSVGHILVPFHFVSHNKL